jgi:hypothetical protein
LDTGTTAPSLGHAEFGRAPTTSQVVALGQYTLKSLCVGGTGWTVGGTV